MHVVNYTAFRDDFRTQKDESELHLLEKFHAARVLSRNGDLDTFIDPIIYDPDQHSHRMTTDLAGVEDGNLTAVFCETEQPGDSLIKDLEVLDQADNSKAVVVYPFKVDSDLIDSKFHEAVTDGKFIIEHLNWSDRSLERAFREALELMDLLCNETRVKMLLPLLEQPQGKRYFREGINPKLIYENVPLLRTHKIIDELSDDLYDLTPIGKTILCEYLSFVEKVRHLLSGKEEED